MLAVPTSLPLEEIQTCGHKSSRPLSLATTNSPNQFGVLHVLKDFRANTSKKKWGGGMHHQESMGGGGHGVRGWRGI